MKQKSILIRLLSVVCMICCCLSLVFGAAACGETEAVKAIKSLSMNANGDIVVVYTDDTTETVKNNKAEVSVCAHEDIYVMETTEGSEEYATIEYLLKKSMENPEEFDVKTLPADRCHLDKIGICKECGDLVATFAGHKKANVHIDATCTLGSYDGEACEYCSWTAGARNNDALGHKMAAVADPIDFQEGLLNKTINKCVDTYYTSVELCERCGYIEIATAEATGHTFDKEALVETKIADKNSTYKLTGTCVDCGTSATVVELPKLAEGDYAVVSGGSVGYDGHLVDYKYTGTADIKLGKFSDGTTTYAFEDKIVTTDDFEENHYIYKGEEKVEPYGKVLGDYADGVYTNLTLAANADELTCDKDAAGSAASAVCEFCRTSFPTTVKKAHTYSEDEAEKVVSYGADPCTAAHTEIWKCETCGEHEVANVPARGHAYILDETRGDKGVSFNEETNKVTLYFVCEHNAAHTKTETADDVAVVKAETCGTAGTYEYTKDGQKWTFSKAATGKHVYEAGKVVEYTTGNKIEYADAAAYIDKSVILDANAGDIVCGQDNEAILICPDCDRYINVIINRAHKLDEEHSKPAAQTCVGDAYSVKYCAYEKCANKYVDGINDTPYESGKLNARHTAVKFVKVEGGVLTVECTKCEETFTVSTFEKEETVKNLECADYAAGKYNYNTYTFEYAIAGNTAEEYSVIEKLSVNAHKFGVTIGMEVDPATTPNAAAILAASTLSADDKAEDCKHSANYSYVCKDCNRAVAITVKGDHVNTDGIIEEATCEEAAYYNCDACTTKIYVDGSVALTHDAKIVVNEAKDAATITCSRCELNLTVTTAQATAGAAVNCEDCNYTYKYVKGEFEQTFAFVAKKIGGTSHNFLKVGTENVIFKYVVIDGAPVVYDATNSAHAGKTIYDGNYCVTCGAFVHPPVLNLQ